MNQTVLAQELVLKYESWKVLREILPYLWVFCHPRSNPTEKFISGTRSFQSRCVPYENCKRPRRNHTSKLENCFAIFILVCNFHISLQFSYQFAILTFWYSSYVTFAIFIWVCNFHMSLQFSYQFAILTSRLEDFLRTRLHTDSHVTMNLNS